MSNLYKNLHAEGLISDHDGSKFGGGDFGGGGSSSTF
jgi:hypothetical protein